jgi:hypothetical protein
MSDLEDKRVNMIGKNDTDAPACGRTWARMFVFFLSGAVVSGAWFTRDTWVHCLRGNAEAGRGAPVVALSPATETVLQRLQTPVEIRYYSLLDNSGGSSLRAFSGRVDQLLARYEQAAGGKLIVNRSETPSEPSADAASADGMTPFNLDKGNGCYLGLAVVCDRQKESLPILAPEWEQALEPDLTRAIERAAAQRAAPTPMARRAAPATLESVKRMIPNINSVSVEQGKQTIREASLAEFKRSVQEMQAKEKAAEDRFLKAQADQSEAGQEAARKELKQIQADQLAKVQQLTASFQARMDAFDQIKAASH